MSHPFDATLNELVRRYPLDWLSGLGLDVELRLDIDRIACWAIQIESVSGDDDHG